MKQAHRPIRKTESRYSIEALARGLNVLALFSSESPSLSLTDIVDTLRLGKSTAFRVLSTLEALGYLERDPTTRRYRPGLKVLQLGFTALNGLEVGQVARPYLERLAQGVNETASLGVLDGMRIIYVDRIRNQAIVGVVIGIGSHVPAHCTSLGKALLADLPPDELDCRLADADLTAYTSRTIVDRQALLAELALVRQRGYATSDEELAVGLRAVAAPIRNVTQKAVAAINVSGPVTTISRERLKTEIMPAVVKTAAQISLALGCSEANKIVSR
jgi:IclR family pca regulon transcriptional regulator